MTVVSFVYDNIIPITLCTVSFTLGIVAKPLYNKFFYNTLDKKETVEITNRSVENIDTIHKDLQIEVLKKSLKAKNIKNKSQLNNDIDTANDIINSIKKPKNVDSIFDMFHEKCNDVVVSLFVEIQKSINYSNITIIVYPLMILICYFMGFVVFVKLCDLINNSEYKSDFKKFMNNIRLKKLYGSMRLRYRLAKFKIRYL